MQAYLALDGWRLSSEPTDETILDVLDFLFDQLTHAEKAALDARWAPEEIENK